MDKLQQEINDFHEAVKLIVEKILKYYEKEKNQKIYEYIKKPAKGLLQKCSYKSSFDTSSLCSLAYWLYIYDNKELALEICELSHKVNFDFEYGDMGIQNIYGLEIRIAREHLEEDRRKNFTSDFLNYSFSKRVKKQVRYPQILREEDIATCNNSTLEAVLFFALCNMIGKGETGLYPELNENWEEIELAIQEYIACLQKE